MNNKSYIYLINGLLIPKQEDSNKIAKSIDEYIELIPALTESLKEALSKQKTSYFIRGLKTALALLQNVCARWLATDAQTLIKSAERGHTDMCKRLIEPFVSDLLSLSIDMQMAKKSDAQKMQVTQNKLDVYTDIVNNVTAIGKLTSEAEYSQAKQMLADISALQENETVYCLTEALRQNDPEQALCFIKKIRDQYIEMIVQLGGCKNGLEQKILAVDDRPEILASVGRILKERYKVLCAPSGAAAIKIFTDQKPDLFLLDIDMPSMDGFTLAKTIRGFEEYQKTPIIFLTSNANSDYVLRALQSGGNDFIVKPANRDILLTKTAKYLL